MHRHLAGAVDWDGSVAGSACGFPTRLSAGHRASNGSALSSEAAARHCSRTRRGAATNSATALQYLHPWHDPPLRRRIRRSCLALGESAAPDPRHNPDYFRRHSPQPGRGRCSDGRPDRRPQSERHRQHHCQRLSNGKLAGSSPFTGVVSSLRRGIAVHPLLHRRPGFPCGSPTLTISSSTHRLRSRQKSVLCVGVRQSATSLDSAQPVRGRGSDHGNRSFRGTGTCCIPCLGIRS